MSLSYSPIYFFSLRLGAVIFKVFQQCFLFLRIVSMIYGWITSYVTIYWLKKTNTQYFSTVYGKSFVSIVLARLG